MCTYFNDDDLHGIFSRVAIRVGFLRVGSGSDGQPDLGSGFYFCLLRVSGRVRARGRTRGSGAVSNIRPVQLSTT